MTSLGPRPRMSSLGPRLRGESNADKLVGPEMLNDLLFFQRKAEFQPLVWHYLWAWPWGLHGRSWHQRSLQRRGLY
jgi:hypothetical protein